MSPPEIPVGRWKRLEYERLVEGGFLGPGDPIELLGGQLIVEPDLAVVPGSFRDYRAEHPSRPVLVVEVAESSLLLDREHKGSLYARARIADQAQSEGLFTESLMAAVAESTPDAQDRLRAFLEKRAGKVVKS